MTIKMKGILTNRHDLLMKKHEQQAWVVQELSRARWAPHRPLKKYSIWVCPTRHCAIHPGRPEAGRGWRDIFGGPPEGSRWVRLAARFPDRAAGWGVISGAWASRSISQPRECRSGHRLLVLRREPGSRR
jgi:hypothetical protein